MSPIRNLVDFYSRKLNKMQTAGDTKNKFLTTSRSPIQART